jgi:DNA-binding response OmpR family regulator
VLTGSAYRAIQLGALEAGADAFLTEPCLPGDLELTIRQMLAGRGASPAPPRLLVSGSSRTHLLTRLASA